MYVLLAFNFSPMSPVISKAFEMVLLELDENYLYTDDLQFGVKKKIGFPLVQCLPLDKF